MQTLLDDSAKTLLRQERALLTRLRDLLGRMDMPEDTRARLGDVIAHLDALFLVVVVGEFNAGKSSLLNALFGETIMEEGPIPTTAKITILKHGEQAMTRQLSEYLVERRHPAQLLRYLNLVDTPGTNSIVQRHQEITEDFVPRADLVLFVTSFDRPLSESERQFLDFLRGAWGKKLVFVLNKKDLAEDEAALDQVLRYLRDSSYELMGLEPQIFAVSARQAQRAQKSEPRDEALWERSGFAGFERFLQGELAGEQQLGLKLTAPLDTAASLLRVVEGRVAARQESVAEAERDVTSVRARLETARETLSESYRAHLDELDRLLRGVEDKGLRFMDDTIQASRIGLLRDKDRYKDEFARQVVGDLDRQVEDQVTEAVDALVTQALAVWNQVAADLAERGRRAKDGDTFRYNRSEVLLKLIKTIERRMKNYDMREEARRILENAQGDVDLLQRAGLGAAGLGALSGALIVTTTLDVLGGFGLLTAGALAIMAFTVLPRQRRKAKAAFSERMDALRTELRKAVSAQLEEQTEQSFGLVAEALRPHAEAVRGETALLREAEAEAKALGEETARLRAEIGALA